MGPDCMIDTTATLDSGSTRQMHCARVAWRRSGCDPAICAGVALAAEPPGRPVSFDVAILAVIVAATIIPGGVVIYAVVTRREAPVERIIRLLTAWRTPPR